VPETSGDCEEMSRMPRSTVRRMLTVGIVLFLASVVASALGGSMFGVVASLAFLAVCVGGVLWLTSRATDV
jgi:FtsH-binding integral membrane protein